MPDREPLDLRSSAPLVRDGYSVSRVYWQTWPGVYASGWFYRPAEVQGRTAAILNPHGHWQDGACHPVVQSRLISQAKLGYVALAVDSVHAYDYAVGLTPMTVMTLNNLRALDLLQSLPEVDRDRLGVTGASGGAQQAMYLLAVDDRIRAAVLAVLVSYFRRILMPDRHHCPCNHIPGMLAFTDEPELCGVFSPRALQFLTVSGDWTAEFPDHELGELRALYRLWGQEDRLDHQGFVGPHDYSRPMREAAYNWFERELRGNRQTVDIREPVHEVEPLAALRALDCPPPEDRGISGVREWFQKRVVSQPPQLEGRDARRSYQQRVGGELRRLIGGCPDPVAHETQAHGEATIHGRVAAKVSFRSEVDVRVPALWVPPSSDAHSALAGHVLLAAYPSGKAAVLADQAVACFLDAGAGLLALDVRLTGELQVDWLHNSLLWGRPEAGMAVTDLTAGLEWLLGRSDVDPSAITILGAGSLGVAAMLTAALDERVAACVADCCDSTYRDGGEELPVIPNILRVADLPQIASIIAPRPLWLWRVPRGRVGFSSRRYYDWTRRTYQSLGAGEAVELSTGSNLEGDVVAAWIRDRVRPQRRGRARAGRTGSPGERTA
jgi:dienelactone hydrolase